jgi:hypothetical protein
MEQIQKQLHMLSASLVVIFTLYVSIKRILFSKTRLPIAIYLALLIFIVAAIFLGSNRSTYLPFLGETVMPCSILKETTPENADFEVRIQILSPGKKVLFWASEPESNHLSELVDWRKAYLGFHNAGVTTIGEDNHVILRVRKPQPYTVPVKGRLEAHIHYRVCGEKGMLGPVQTYFLETDDVEPKTDESLVGPDTSEPFWASAI